jgi:hypothetical protein
MKATSRPATSRSRRFWFATIMATPALVLALAGCTASTTDATGSSSGGSTAEQPSSDAENSAARDTYDRKLAQCFRDQGLDVKDPLPGKGIVEDGPEIQAAYPACAAEIGDPPSNAGMTLTPDQLEKLLDRATCLRDKGYDISEPTTTDPGFIPAEVSPEDFEICENA